MALDTTTYKATLTEELARVTAELETLGVRNPNNPRDWVPTAAPDEGGSDADPIDVADQVEESGEREATLAQLEHEYNDVKRALDKIDKGAYGICEISEEPIEEDRLNANPAARACKAHMNEEASLPQ